MQNPLRHLPSVSELLANPRLKEAVDSVNHHVVVNAARRVLDDVRSQVRQAAHDAHVPSPSELVERISDWVQHHEQPRLQPVINATGVVLHTGLGRAPLSRDAVEAIVQVAQGYCTLEVERTSGQRSQRTASVEPLLCELTGAEAALVVNNNAAATLLTLSALAAGREVIVSRGQLVEIGGNFRLPDVMTACGARLREVGTTNKTRIEDYAQAIQDETGLLMLVHPSNYRVVGFTENVSLSELVKLGQRHGIPVVDDIGSGALLDFSRYGLHDEPQAATSIAQGADLVLFSGDKLVGGPQAGIVCGKKAWIERLARHPMMRAMRVDKLTLAALHATLKRYRDLAQAEQHIPLLAMLQTPVENLRYRAERVRQQLEDAPHLAEVRVEAMEATLGGGSLPTQRLDSFGLVLVPRDGSPQRFAQRLRDGEPSLFTRVQDETVWLDFRTVFPAQDRLVVDAIRQLGPESESEAAPGAAQAETVASEATPASSSSDAAQEPRE